jgi:hypothetical protein
VFSFLNLIFMVVGWDLFASTTPCGVSLVATSSSGGLD